MAITRDGSTFIFAESYGDRIMAMDRAHDGSLSNPRVWAKVPDGCMPDGIVLDADGNLWVPCAGDRHLRLIAEGGEVLEDHDFGERLPVSLALGGAGDKTLYIATCEAFLPQECREKASASIEAIAVAVGGNS
jgi:sugar lactone lactonase YvrE